MLFLNMSELSLVSVNASVKVKDYHFTSLQGEAQSTDTLPTSRQSLNLATANYHFRRRHVRQPSSKPISRNDTSSCSREIRNGDKLHEACEHCPLPQSYHIGLLTASRLLETGQGADMTITCKGKTFKVHSAIVASRSDFFAAACWGSFKVRVEL